MDRETINQLDRIERGVMNSIEGISILMQKSMYDGVKTFIENEVFDKRGSLHHLKGDNKIKEFYDNFVKEEPEEDEELIDDEEYVQDE